MSNTYSDKLKLRIPAKYDGDWRDEQLENSQIIDFRAAGLSSGNYLIYGGIVTAGSGFTANYSEGIVVVGGYRYDITASSVTLTPNKLNFIYVNSSGSVAASITLPSGDHVPLAIADVSGSAILRVGDLRQVAQGLFYDNLVINGEILIDQANCGSAISVTTTESYLADQVSCPGCTHAAVVNAQRASSSYSKNGYCAKLTVTTADTLSGNEVGHGIVSYLEYKDAVPLKDRYAAIRFKFRSNVTGTFSAALLNSDSDYVYVFDFTVSSSGVPVTVTKYISVPASYVADGTSNRSLKLIIGRTGVGNRATSTTDEWVATGGVWVSSSTSAVDWETSISNYIEVWEIEIYVDELPHCFISDIDILHRCQRYYQKTYAQNTALGTETHVGLFRYVCAKAGYYQYFPHQFPVIMRATPTVYFYSYDGTADRIRNMTTETNVTVTQVLSASDRQLGGAVIGTAALAEEQLGFFYTLNARM